MKENTKKKFIIAGLAAVCVLLVLGISMVLYREPVRVLPEESIHEEEPVVNMEDITMVPDNTSNTEEEKELVIQPEPESSVESGKQEIQQPPEKTEDEKPQEPPALPEDEDTTNPDKEPVYEEPEKHTPPASDTPKTGDTKDGMIYIEGFGWVPDEGGGGSGTVADDMYENGNKVGIMD